jgi:rod shape-determining protein MreC
MLVGDKLVSSGMGQVYPKNYPVAEIISVYADPGQDFATVKARPLAQIASTRHVMLVFQNENVEEPALDLIDEEFLVSTIPPELEDADTVVISDGQITRIEHDVADQ